MLCAYIASDIPCARRITDEKEMNMTIKKVLTGGLIAILSSFATFVAVQAFYGRD